MPQSFRDVIQLFGGPAAFSREVGIPVTAAKQAHLRSQLAARWFVPTAEAARRLGIADVNETALAQIAMRQSMAA